MFFKKTGIEFKKITFNLEKDHHDRLEEIALFYLCDKSVIIKDAIKDYIKKHDKKMEKLKKRE